MASNSSIKVKDKTRLKKNVENINAQMIVFAQGLKDLSDNLSALMTGNKKSPYWDGPAADKFYTNAVANLKRDIADYVVVRDELEVLGRLYELVNGGYLK